MGVEDFALLDIENLPTDLMNLPQLVKEQELEDTDLTRLRALSQALDQHGLNVNSHSGLKAALSRAAFVPRMRNEIRELIVRHTGADTRLYWIRLPIELIVIDSDDFSFSFDLEGMNDLSRDYQPGSPLSRHCNVLGIVMQEARGLVLINAGFDVIESAEQLGLPLDIFRKRIQEVFGPRAMELEFHNGSESKRTPERDPIKAKAVLRLDNAGKVQSSEIEFIYS